MEHSAIHSIMRCNSFQAAGTMCSAAIPRAAMGAEMFSAISAAAGERWITMISCALQMR